MQMSATVRPAVLRACPPADSAACAARRRCRGADGRALPSPAAPALKAGGVQAPGQRRKAVLVRAADDTTGQGEENRVMLHADHHYTFSFLVRGWVNNRYFSMVDLGAGYYVQVSSDGRQHGGRVSIELFDPRTGQPCSLQEWRALVPAPDPWLRQGPIVQVDSSGGQAHIAPKSFQYAASEQHGVRMGILMTGRRSEGTACLLAGTPKPSGYSPFFELA